MRVVNTDANSHWAKIPEKCLQDTERAKKNMYLDSYPQYCQHFLPFIVSINGLLGVEATATLKSIASRLTKKWRQPYSRTCIHVKSRIAITLVRAKNRCIRGSRVLVHRIRVQCLQWEEVAKAGPLQVSASRYTQDKRRPHPEPIP